MSRVLLCSAEAYWRCVVDEAYHRRLYLDVLRYRAYDHLGTERDATTVRVRQFVDPSLRGAPEVVVRALKALGAPSWVEEIVVDLRSSRLRSHYKMSTLPDRMHVASEVSCIDLGNGTCERRQETEVSVRLFGVGGVLETAILDDIEKTFGDAFAEFTAKYAIERGWC